jgi:PAS domain S-box-containing protein
LSPDSRVDKARLAALRRYEILDSASEAAFDDLAFVAAQLCATPIALISLVDDQRQWFKSRIGLKVEETPQEIAFCAHTLETQDVFEVPDAVDDARFRDNPLVTGPPRIRFYAGAPLITPDGFNLGTLCVIDRVPRRLTGAQRDALLRLGRQVVSLLELRRASLRPYQALVESSPDAILIHSDWTIRFANRAMVDLLGARDATDIVGRSPESLLPESQHAELRARIERLYAGEALKRAELLYRRFDGTLVPVEAAAAPLSYEGRPAVQVTVRDISVRRQAEAAVRAAEEHFRRAIEEAPFPLLMHAEDGEVLALSRTWTELSGYTREDMPTIADWTERAYGDRKLAVRSDIEALYALARRKHEGEYQVTCRDGTVRLWDFSSVAIGALPDGRRAVVSMAVDVTRRRHIEEALRASDTRYRAIVNAQDDAVCRWLPDTTLTFVNAGYLALFGLTEAEALGRPWLEFVPAAERDAVSAFYRALAQDPRKVEFDHSLTAADGSTRWFSWTDVPLYGKDGGLLEFQSVGRDITRRKHVEEALRDSEARYRALFESNPHPMWVYDLATLRFLAVNDAAVEHYGYSRDEFLAMAISEIRPEEDVARLHENVARVTAGFDHAGIWRHRRKDGSLIDVEITSHTLDFDGRPAEVVLAHDVTVRLQAEAEIRRLNATLEQRVRDRTAELETANQELESFSFSVSHDLRSPLRSIDGFAQILAEEYAGRLDDEGRRLLGVVQREAVRMGELIDDLLRFSRLGRAPLNRDRVDMQALAREVYEALPAATKRDGVEFTLRAMPAAWADSALIRQVWTNLLDNALKYTRGREPALIEAGGNATDDDCCEFYVTDNGAGFDMKYAGRLFGVFQRLHRDEDFEGTGVGLALVRRIVNRHGGRIWAEAEPGKGARFRFTLPNPKEPKQ